MSIYPESLSTLVVYTSINSPDKNHEPQLSTISPSQHHISPLLFFFKNSLSLSALNLHNHLPSKTLLNNTMLLNLRPILMREQTAPQLTKQSFLFSQRNSIWMFSNLFATETKIGNNDKKVERFDRMDLTRVRWHAFERYIRFRPANLFSFLSPQYCSKYA